MSQTGEKTNTVSSILNKTIYRATKSVLGLINSGRTNGVGSRHPYVSAWSYYVKMYRKTGVNIRQAVLLSPEGDALSHDGDCLLTSTDIKKIKDILVDGEACKDILYLDNLYYCVKQLTDSVMVLFNGTNYVMACATPSKHLMLVNVKARKLDSAKAITWLQSVADDLDTRIDPL